MAGKRLLDLAALFNASRGIAQKHAALRSRQLDVYNRTSTLARAVRNQTDRVTETAKAASFLASRLNESAPTWASENNDDKASGQSNEADPIPRRQPAAASNTSQGEKSGLEQDHFYESSQENGAIDDPPAGSLHIHQEQDGRRPLPDGTIPLKESDIYIPKVKDDAITSRLQDGPLKRPLDDNEVFPESSSTSTIPTPTRPLSSNAAKTLQRQSEFQIPSQSADAVSDRPVDALNEGHDQESFYQTSGHTSPSLSSLPRVKIPKYTSNTQGGMSEFPSGKIDSDSFYNAGDQEQPPEDVNTDLFLSPRVARKLGGRLQGGSRRNDRASPYEKPGAPAPAVEPRPAVSNDFLNTNEDTEKLAQEIRREVQESTGKDERDPELQPTPYELRESKVPSSRLGRLWNYGGLAAGMFGGVVSESIRRVSGTGGEGSYILSAGNMDRLVSKLSRMRGAALKMGQMISFQDSKMLPAPIQEVLQRVQDRADYMPASQRDKVLSANLGPDWRELFSSFDEKPLAAASIGQVHSAILKSTGARVAVKVQYPGVADSIDSDLNNLAILLTASRLLPKGLFLDKTIANARTELAWECDYIREAECARRFQELLADETDVFLVPKIYAEASGKQVLTMEFMDGIGVTRVQNFSQEQRDWIGTQILRLCLREITEFKYMQTDPNWTNFLYNATTNKLELLDFGASREYPEEFITAYSKLLAAAARSDKDTVRDLSIELGYLTGQESKTMLNAHIASVLTLGEPFLDSSPEVYDFRDQTITDRVKELIPVMIKERLSPPPEETYSLHRKLSGAFLLCAKLGSRVRCRDLFQNSMKKAGII